MANKGGIQMNKILSFLSALMITGCASEQAFYSFRITFNNMCIYPVRITASPYASYATGGEILSQNLGIGESTYVFLESQPNIDIKQVVSNDYKLEISANGKTIRLDKYKFLEVLKKK